MKNKVWFLWVLILFTMASCTQKETPTSHVQPLYARAATYQTGSYFVFRDSLTHVLDSFYVTLCDTSVYTPPNERIETITSEFKNSANEEFYFYANGGLAYLTFDFKGITAYTYSDFIYGHNLRVGFKLIDSYFSNYCLARYDTLLIDNREYYNVYETLFQKNSSYLHKWYSLQDGLIKMRLHGNGVDKVYTTLRHLQLN